jgi:hypothetical protein
MLFRGPAHSLSVTSNDLLCSTYFSITKRKVGRGGESAIVALFERSTQTPQNIWKR